ncbi:hypothetical protein OIO90_004637 [Microbotryomycetes sp. JL221]|nr:hypothetical protein OIO90_004637 [Microbotryomycetes sp. JL221]
MSTEHAVASSQQHLAFAQEHHATGSAPAKNVRRGRKIQRTSSIMKLPDSNSDLHFDAIDKLRFVLVQRAIAILDFDKWRNRTGGRFNPAPRTSFRERAPSFVSTSTSSSAASSISGGPSTPETQSPQLPTCGAVTPSDGKLAFAPTALLSSNVVVLNKLDALWASFSRLDESDVGYGPDLMAFGASSSFSQPLTPISALPEVDELSPWIDVSKLSGTGTGSSWLESSASAEADLSHMFGLS